MKQRLCFRLSAASCTKRHVFEHEYFGVAVGKDEYYFPAAFGEILEFQLFRMVVDVWCKRRAPMVGRTRLNLEAVDRQSLRLIVAHVREAWRAYLDGNELLARYEFRTAETHWLRFGFSQMARIAGAALLEMQSRSIDGRRNAEKRWRRGAESVGVRNKRISDAVAQGVAVTELAKSYNLTSRRIQQIAKKKTK